MCLATTKRGVPLEILCEILPVLKSWMSDRATAGEFELAGLTNL